jgi:hypothetical protein
LFTPLPLSWLIVRSSWLGADWRFRAKHVHSNDQTKATPHHRKSGCLQSYFEH